MPYRFEVDGWKQYAMDWYDPHRQLEAPDHEIAVIDQALDAS